METVVRDDEYLAPDFVVYIGEIHVSGVCHLDAFEQSIDCIVFIAQALTLFV